MQPKQILDEQGISRALTRIAHEIVERNKGIHNLVLIGLRSGGDHLARLLGQQLAAIEGAAPPLGAVDITLYRDDLRHCLGKPVGRTELPCNLDNMHIVLVDEVIYTGRTLRAALDALMDYGRPASVQVAVLVDRGHRELPLRPDFVGRNLPTSREETVEVAFNNQDTPEAVWLYPAGNQTPKA